MAETSSKFCLADNHMEPIGGLSTIATRRESSGEKAIPISPQVFYSDFQRYLYQPSISLPE
jgi:hypothetical protein